MAKNNNAEKQKAYRQHLKSKNVQAYLDHDKERKQQERAKIKATPSLYGPYKCKNKVRKQK